MEAASAPRRSLTLLRSYSSSYSYLHVRVRNAATSQILFNLSDNLADLERAALHFRERHRIDQVPRPDHRAELAQVHLRNNHRFKCRQHFTKVAREWIQVT